MRRLVFSELNGRKSHHHIAIPRVHPGERTALHTHDFPELFLTLDGAGSHCWNGRRSRIEAGDLVFLLASDYHQFECGRTDSLKLINLALAPAWWKSLEPLLGASAPHADPARRRRRLGPREAGECARRLHRVLKDDAEDTAALLEAVALGARSLRVAAEVALVPEADLGRAPEWLARLVSELEEPDAADRPLGHWQRRSGRSPEHLARCCRQYLGCTLTEMVRRARLSRAKAELREGKGKIAEVAAAAGFNNLGHFYRTFRIAEGSSPKKWADAHAGASTIPRSPGVEFW